MNASLPVHFVLFLLYAVALAFLCIRLKFFRESGLRPMVLVFFFFYRVAFACAHTWIAWKYFPNHGDIWSFFHESTVLQDQLLHNFPAFKGNIIPPYTGNHPLFNFISYFQTQFVINLNFLFDFLSFNNLYINSLLFSFLTFWGNIALFRLLRKLYPDNPLAAFMSMILPSTIFWSACIHKEGILYMSLGFLFFYFQQLMEQGLTWRKLFRCVFFLLIAFICRAHILFIILPGLLIWGLKGNRDWRRSWKLLLFLAIPSILLLLPGLLGNHFNLLYQVWERNMEFRNLEGHSRIYFPTLNPDAWSFLKVLPAAIRNGFLEPTPGAGGQSFYTLFSIELILIWLVIIYASLSVHKNPYRFKGFDYAFLSIACMGLLLIGYTIPFVGAIIRYRSLFLPFLLIPFLQLLERETALKALNQKLTSLIFIKF